MKINELEASAVATRPLLAPTSRTGQPPQKPPTQPPPRNAAEPAGNTHRENPATANLRFQIDEATGKVVISVINPTDGSVIRQMPSEEALAIAKSLGHDEAVFVDRDA